MDKMKTENDESTREARSLDAVVRRVEAFNAIYGSSYTPDDYKWDLHQGAKDVCGFDRGWEAAHASLASELEAQIAQRDPREQSEWKQGIAAHMQHFAWRMLGEISSPNVDVSNRDGSQP